MSESVLTEEHVSTASRPSALRITDLRVANLHQGDEPEGAVLGARVSLSFSNFAPAADAVPAAPGGGATQVHSKRAWQPYWS